MLLKPEPLFAAIEKLSSANSKIILLTPQGQAGFEESELRRTQAGRLESPPQQLFHDLKLDSLFVHKLHTFHQHELNFY